MNIFWKEIRKHLNIVRRFSCNLPCQFGSYHAELKMRINTFYRSYTTLPCSRDQKRALPRHAEQKPRIYVRFRVDLRGFCWSGVSGDVTGCVFPPLARPARRRVVAPHTPYAIAPRMNRGSGSATQLCQSWVNSMNHSCPGEGSRLWKRGLFITSRQLLGLASRVQNKSRIRASISERHRLGFLDILFFTDIWSKITWRLDSIDVNRPKIITWTNWSNLIDS